MAPGFDFASSRQAHKQVAAKRAVHSSEGQHRASVSSDILNFAIEEEEDGESDDGKDLYKDDSPAVLSAMIDDFVFLLLNSGSCVFLARADVRLSIPC